MKTSQDPRHQHRRELLQKLFAYSFDSQQTDNDLAPIIAATETIDAQITAAAPQWPIAKIAKIDLAILRLALFELTTQKQEPPKVIIDEAVELAHEFGNDHSSQFINGVLGTILKTL